MKGNKTELLDRFARDGEERLLLGRLLDRQAECERRGVPSHSAFLTQEEQARAEDFLRLCPGAAHVFYGGYPQAQRRVCLFLPDWMEGPDFSPGEEPLCALEAKLRGEESLGHREILGSLMGLGITRETLGDLLPGPERCQVVALRSALPILLSQWEGAARQRFTPVEIPLSALSPQPPQVKTLRDTVASLRLDALLGVGFSTSRARAGEWIAAGRVSVNHRECRKGDKLLCVGDTITCRGQGKCVFASLEGQTKKGRCVVVVERYL